MSKLIKELDAKKVEDLKKKNENVLVKEAETLLLNAHDEDIKVLKDAGLSHYIEYEESKQEVFNSLNHHSEKYVRKCYTGKQIKELCIAYDLRCLPSQLYNGSIDGELASKIKNFFEQIDKPVNRDHLFILAPVEQFNTIEHVPLNTDPVLFYCENRAYNKNSGPNENDTLVLLHQWGDDFKNSRIFRILTNRMSSRNSDGTNAMMTNIGIFVILVSLISTFTGLHPIAGTIISSLGILFIFSSIGSTFRDENWNTNKV